ncbi:MAG: hypothetical protein A2V21_313270 [Deltaproteobacteria bacterium GWC2_55_46]|nr:MAG: hypothetical protein A2Z79_07450 [Deltaproteobacteria bacterium GWA2_55_82]OIJ72599.1 MAG: hypothetical protein A2V21_313270 [Deltaproteobacteria bacterium GWC2_55_46]HCY11943.1 hypothetical protein [Deltaproteobacteria bacterium]
MSRSKNRRTGKGAIPYRLRRVFFSMLLKKSICIVGFRSFYYGVPKKYASFIKASQMEHLNSLTKSG